MLAASKCKQEELDWCDNPYMEEPYLLVYSYITE